LYDGSNARSIGPFLNLMSSNPLDYITIRGFKSIASLEKLELRPINVLIGPNGSGKSNFLGVFALLDAIGELGLSNYVQAAGGAEKVLHFGSKTTKEIHICVSFVGEENLEITLRPTGADNLFMPDDINGWKWRRSLSMRPEQGRRTRYHDRRWRLYHFSDTSTSSPMRKTANVDDNVYLRPDASNLAAFLYYLRERHEPSYKLIQKTIQQVAPFFDDFDLKPLKLKPDSVKIEWTHKDFDQYFDASSLSDGTLRFIALATLFLQPEDTRPALILVDEPELGLHPYAIELLASLIRQASVASQVIVSTQSSLLVDHFEPEEVLVADRVEGGTQLTRLDPTRLASWLEDYSLGQLWEKNELGGRPVPN
jgi:predicted ATPase